MGASSRETNKVITSGSADKYKHFFNNNLLVFQNEEKGKRAEELIIANNELVFQNREKEKRAAELIIANKELAFQNKEKEKRAAELFIANEELAYQNNEKEKRAEELIIANNELVFQNGEKEKRAAELIIANQELAFQNKEKEKRAAELIIANKELAFQNKEKEKRADELIIANEELLFQNREKEKRAEELIVANIELVFQNEEKEKRAAELVIANEELAFQGEEKSKRADELSAINDELRIAKDEIRKQNDGLEQKVAKRTAQYAFLSQINQSIVHIKDEVTLFRNACRIAIETGKFKMAWIGMLDQDRRKITLVEQNGIAAEDIIQVTDAPLLVNGPQEVVLRTSDYFICNDVQHEPALEAWKSFALQHGVQSCMVLPIKKSGSIIGTFNFYSTDHNFFGSDEIALLWEVTGDISFALDNYEKEKKHAATEERVIQSEKRFRSLIEKSAEMITLADGDGRITYTSSSLSRILGYENSEVLETSVLSLIHPDDSPGLAEKMDHILLTPGESFYNQHRIRNKLGAWIWCEGTVTNLLKEPSVNAMVSNLRDMSERKMEEHKFALTSNELFRTLGDLQKIMNSSLDMICSIDQDGKFVKVSSASENILGYEPDELIGRKFMDFVFTEDLDRTAKAAEGVMNGLTVTFFENRYIHSNGSVVPIVWSAIWDKNDNLMYCVAKDVTEKKSSEEKLAEKEQQLTLLIENSPAALAMFDKDMRYIIASKRWSTDYKLGSQQLIGKSHYEVFAGTPPRWKGIYQRCLAGAIEKNNEEAFQAQDGSTGWLRWEIHPWYKKPGEIGGIIMMSEVITERKKAEEDKKDLTERLLIAAQIARLGYWEYDVLNDLFTFNDQFYDIFKTTVQQVGGYTMTAARYAELFVHPDEREIVASSIADAINSDDSDFDFRTEHRIIFADGGLGYISVHFRIVKNSNGTTIKRFGVNQDITKRKKVEIEKQGLIERLQSNNKDLQQFSYIVSHNLRAPIAKILGLVSVIENESEENRFLLEKLSEETTNLDEVVKDINVIVSARKSEGEKMEQVLFKNELSRITKVLETIITESGTTISADFSAVAGLSTIKSYFYSILYNLVSNAIKYRRPDVPLNIEVGSTQVNGSVCLSVKDNGIGIDLAKNGTKIFGLYKRFHTGSIPGKGIGLNLVKTHAETLGGRVEVESEIDEGAIFKVYLPNSYGTKSTE